MNTSKVAVVASAVLGKIASVLGYVFGALSLITIFVGLSDLDSEDAVPAMVILFIVLALCVFSIIKGAQIKRRIKRFKRYVALISTQNMTSLDELGANTNRSVDFVRSDLQKMISKRFFANASIDIATNKIIIGGKAPSAAASSQVRNTTQVEYETFSCSGCGASGTKSKGILGNCEYCGAVIQ